MTPTSHSPLRVAVIGCGFQGSLHARSVLASPSAELAAVCDANPETAASLARSLGVSRVEADPRALTGDPDIDAVIVATTTGTHAEVAIDAARSGTHVLLEKPMATTVDDCLRIEQAVGDAGIRMMIGFKFRFAPAVIRAREAVPAPIVVTAHTLYDATQTTAGWINDRSASGGRLTSSLVHAVDLLRFLARSEPVRVFAEGGALAIDGIEEPDNAVATLRFANGTIGSIVHGMAGRSALLSNWSFQLAGVGRNATVHDHGRRALVHDASEQPDPPAFVDTVEDPFAVGMAPLFEAFAGSILTGTDTAPTARDGTVSLAICRRVEQAIDTGEPQRLDDLF